MLMVKESLSPCSCSSMGWMGIAKNWMNYAMLFSSPGPHGHNFDMNLGVKRSICFVLLTILTVINAKCENPPQINNGYVQISDMRDSYQATDKVKYKCDIGYHADLYNGLPKTESECLQNGEWTEPDITCLPVQCQQLENPQYGRLVGTEVTHGKIITFECFSGYYQWTTFNNMERVCMEDGKWNGEEFQCRPVKCPDLKDMENGRISQKTGVYKTKVEYSCLPDYILTGNKMRECLQNATWSSSSPQCVRETSAGSCPSPYSKAFLEKFKYLAKTEVLRGIKLGHNVTFICKSDANLKVQSICGNNEEWQPSPPSESFCSASITVTPDTTTSSCDDPIFGEITKR
uniref:Sushi domain-containing protein n=1 Tax=Strigamia maritima TaxID=126957 RepID=T1J340_STRMM